MADRGSRLHLSAAVTMAWGAKRRGQAVVLLLALLVAMAALGLWVADIDRYILAKLRVQDGGDAVALSAARWQAAGLNLIGELNLIQAYMLADDVDNFEAVGPIHALRQRIQLTTPMLALAAAQETAKFNNLPPLEPAEEVEELLEESVRYAAFDDAEEPELAAEIYQEMMAVILRDPIRAFPMAPVHDLSTPSYLANQEFYEAVLARDWCWFWFYGYDFMEKFRRRGDFGALPKTNTEPFFGLALDALTTDLDRLVAEGKPIDRQLQDLGHPALPPPPPEEEVSPAHFERPAQVQWTVYRAAAWGPWDRIDELPIKEPVREAYDYDGADVAVSVERNGSKWLAAAKPFGTVGGENPTAYGLVLGGFQKVRLIPVDAADANLSGLDLVWLHHLRHHLPDYVRSGLLQDGCRYCTALRKWEDPVFRQVGLEWLRVNGETCRRPRPGGPSDTGGAKFAH